MRQPSLIEMQGIDLTVEHLFDHLHVVDDAVISTLGQRHHAWHNVLVFNKGVRINFLLDVFPLKLFFRNGTNNAKVVTGWHQENRDRAHHRDRMDH